MSNLKRFAYEQIRAGLLNGKFPIGSTLSPASFSKELGISATPVREAISQLETEGFVEQVPRLGHQVRKVDRDELAELFELRQILEQGAVAKAARRITPGEVEDLRQLCRQYRQLLRGWRDASDPDDHAAIDGQLRRLDSAFHLRLLSAARNRRLVKLVSDLQLMVFLFRRHVEMPKHVAWRRWVVSYGDHCRIVRALAGGDAATAAETLGRHIEGAKGYYLAAFDQFKQAAPSGIDADLAWTTELLGELERSARPERRSRRSRTSD